MSTQGLANLLGAPTDRDWITTTELWAIPILVVLAMLAVVMLNRRWLIAVFNTLVAVPLYDAFRRAGAVLNALIAVPARNCYVRTAGLNQTVGRHRVVRMELAA